jgi:methyl-accepting chemotaxis protein
VPNWVGRILPPNEANEEPSEQRGPIATPGTQWPGPAFTTYSIDPGAWRGLETTSRPPSGDPTRLIQQMREVLRFAGTLRIDLGPDVVMRQIVNTIAATTGFRAAVINLVRDDSPLMDLAAFAGVPPAEQERLRASPPPLNTVLDAMRPEFCISQSYFISHEHAHLLNTIESYNPMSAPRIPGGWHPDDSLLVPMVSSRTGKLLGILSLDDPVDGLIPSREAIEIIELFTNVATLAIDYARLFQEKEASAARIENAINQLGDEVERARQGNLGVHATAIEDRLVAIAIPFNELLAEFSAALVDARQAINAINHNVSNAQSVLSQLTAEEKEQAQEVADVSAALEEMATAVQQVTDSVTEATTVAHDAVDITNEGRSTVLHAVEGMNALREITLQTARKIKRLSESSQEIGEIVQLISDFTSQTSLLALNATIEAARAGEHGRGFSVIAQEIRNLASNSAEATKQIAAHIKGIQGETNAVMVSIEESTQQVVQQSELVTQAGAVLEAIDVLKQRLAQLIESIRIAAEKQAQVSVTVAQSIGNISQITFSTRRSVEQLQLAMSRLLDITERLQRHIGRFQIPGSEA